MMTLQTADDPAAFTVTLIQNILTTVGQHWPSERTLGAIRIAIEAYDEEIQRRGEELK